MGLEVNAFEMQRTKVGLYSVWFR